MTMPIGTTNIEYKDGSELRIVLRQFADYKIIQQTKTNIIIQLIEEVYKMKVENMTGRTGRAVANQFIITDDRNTRFFQSYGSIIVAVSPNRGVQLDTKCWDYSVTTGRYRNQFLGETKKETQAKINSGEYVLADLN